jgi:hypothetical protein
MKYCIVVISFFSCMFHQLHTVPEKEVWITVFIHGTIGLRPCISISTFLKLVCDKIEHSNYKRIVGAIRSDPFFFQSQPMQELGFELIDMNPKHKEGAASAIFANIFDSVLNHHDYQTETYVTFGWSGLLSPSERFKDAYNLYRALQKERQTLQKTYPKTPIKIRLVAYSHGGSVALNLAAVREQKYPDDTFSIDETLMIGVPIQKETERMLCHPIFKQVYHFYSRADKIQKLDCCSLQRFFSNRRFNKTCEGNVPHKLTQVEIKIQVPSKPGAFPRVDRSPNHIELWFFGWTVSGYRSYFPLYPLPTSAILPSLVEMLQKYAPHEQHVIVTLQPTKGVALIRTRHEWNTQEVSWISADRLHQLQEQATLYATTQLTRESYNAHISNAVNLVTQEMELPSKKSCCLCAVGAYTIPDYEKV